MEYFLSKTSPAILQAATRLNWSWSQTFYEFENVLDGALHTAWHEVLHSLPLLDCNLKESFDTTTNAIVKKLLYNNISAGPTVDLHPARWRPSVLQGLDDVPRRVGVVSTR